MVWHNGYIGLHGYTHQHGDEKSLSGNEFGSGINDQEEQIRNIFEMSINTAKQLKIPFTFFEFSHYTATKEKITIAEEYFDCIYQPNAAAYSKKALIIIRNNRKIKYVPTALGYINSVSETENMLRNIDSLEPEILASLFFIRLLNMNILSLARKKTVIPYMNMTKTRFFTERFNILKEKATGLKQSIPPIDKNFSE